MNSGDADTMKALDTRLARLHAGLDARPGFEGRLAARIASLEAQRTAPIPADVRLRLERVHERELAQVARAARVEGLAVALAGLGASIAAWQFGPDLARLTSAASVGLDPAVVALGTLAVAGAALWALLRWFQVDPRSLVGA